MLKADFVGSVPILEAYKKNLSSKKYNYCPNPFITLRSLYYTKNNLSCN